MASDGLAFWRRYREDTTRLRFRIGLEPGAANGIILIVDRLLG